MSLLYPVKKNNENTEGISMRAIKVIVGLLKL